MLNFAELLEEEVMGRDYGLRWYQQEAKEAAERVLLEGRSGLLVFATGLGKCLGRGTLVMTWSGAVLPVEGVRPGMLLMGPDSKPRTVLSTTSGSGPLFRVSPTKGDPWVCNWCHVLTLKDTVTGKVTDVPLDEYLLRTRTYKHRAKLFSVGVDFPQTGGGRPIDPYILGVWLGDGTKNYETGFSVTKPDPEIREALEIFAADWGLNVTSTLSNRCPTWRVVRRIGSPQTNPLVPVMRTLFPVDLSIPAAYLRGSRSVRLALLAGLVDTDGYVAEGCIEIAQKSKELARDVAFLARSLGIKVTVKKKFVNGAEYQRMVLSGELDIIPTRIARKRPPPRKHIKDALRTGFAVHPLGDGDYFGFELDGDGRFLLGDFTVTHNTQVFGAIAADWAKGDVLVLAHRDELVEQAARRIELMTGETVEIEKAHLRSSQRCRIVVGSVQSVTRKNRLERMGADRFGLVITDEAHHYVSPTFRRPLEFFRNAERLGVTATPDRTDEKALGQIFDEVVYVMELTDGIEQGYLVPVKARELICTEVDLGNVKVQAGDLVAGQLDKEMVKAVEGIVAKTCELEPDRLGPCFFPGVKSAELACQRFNVLRPGSARFVYASTPEEERREIMRDVRQGRVRHLCNVGIATEGFDWPEASMVVLGRPTKSRSLFAQMCLDSHTEILTDRGWLRVDDPRDGVRVASFDTRYSANGAGIRWTEPLGWVERPLASHETMWGVDSPHLSIRVTNHHKMVVRERTGRAKNRTPWRLVDAEGVPGEFQVPICGTQQTLPGVDLTDAELRFLGLLMTDGCVNKDTKVATLYQSERYPEALAVIEETVVACGFKYRRDSTGAPTNYGERRYRLHRWHVSFGKPRGAQKHLRGWEALAPYYSKTIHETLTRMTVAQFEVFYGALWLGDGTKRARRSWEMRTMTVCSARKEFADRLQSMAVQRGWKSTVSKQSERMWMIHSRPNKAAWSVSREPSDARPVWGQSPATAGERVWCVTVHSGMIVTRRNGKVAVVGNCGRGTRVLGGLVDHVHGQDGAETRRALVAASAKPDMMILNFVGHGGKHSLVGPEDLLGGKFTEAEIKVAKKKAVQGGATMAALLAAREELRQIAASVTSRVKAEVTSYDPFGIFGIDREELQAQANRYGYKPASLKQRAALMKWGMRENELEQLSSIEASKLMATCIKRSELQLASVGKMRLFREKGIAVPTNLSRSAADRIIEHMKASNWKAPDPSRVEALMHYQREPGDD